MGLTRTAHYTLTLNGSAQALSSLLGSNQDFPLRSISLQPDPANGNPIYVGADATLSSSAFGVRLEASVSGVPPAPWEREFSHGPMRLADFYVLGTNTEKLHVFVVRFGQNG